MKKELCGKTKPNFFFPFVVFFFFLVVWAGIGILEIKIHYRVGQHIPKTLILKTTKKEFSVFGKIPKKLLVLIKILESEIEGINSEHFGYRILINICNKYHI